MKKISKILLWGLVSIIVILLIYVATTALPVMTGMAARTMCSCVYVTGRSPASVIEKELQVFPGLASSKIEMNNADSSVTASILWKTSKAIYRKGLGCTLLAEQSEAEVRNQKINAPQPASVNQDTIAWPTGNRVANSTVEGVNYHALNKTVNEAFHDIDPDNKIHTHAVVVVYNGELIAEKYADGFDYNSRLMGWSMAKTVTNALVGILVNEGKLKLDDPVPIQEWQNDERKKITINNLLKASSGLAWGEEYFIPSSDFHTMFIKRDNKAAYAASRKLEHEPGSFFKYSGGTTNILCKIVRDVVGNDKYYQFPYANLFYKIGMNRAIMEVDASGTFVGSSLCYASARDWARFGMLYLNDGIWNGERIFPEGWVDYSFTPSPAAPKREYGAQIWLNLGEPSNPANVEYPGLPNEAIIFDGFERNYVVLIPSKKLVVVRLGVTHNRNFSLANLVNGIIDAVK